METQLKSSRAKQKNKTKGQSKLPGRTERISSAGPLNESDHSRRVFVSSTNKRAPARFAKGPTETAGFLYPRRHAESLHKINEESLIPLEVEVLPPNPLSLQQSSTTVLESAPVPTSEPLGETNSLEYGLENVDLNAREETATTLCEEPSEQTTQITEVDSKVLLNTLTKSRGDELPDDTVGPDDSESSESESFEESEAEIVKPIAIPIPVVPQIVRSVNKPTPTPVVRKTATPVVLPAHRKVLPMTSPTPRSSWSKFLPLVIEIKATIPYPMHLLGFAMFLVVALILGLSYQFGADLGSGSDLQAQIFRLFKLALLFMVVAICVNFVEDNKELPQNDVVPPIQPKLRGRANKNKKKMKA